MHEGFYKEPYLYRLRTRRENLRWRLTSGRTNLRCTSWSEKWEAWDTGWRLWLRWFCIFIAPMGESKNSTSFYLYSWTINKREWENEAQNILSIIRRLLMLAAQKWRFHDINMDTKMAQIIPSVPWSLALSLRMSDLQHFRTNDWEVSWCSDLRWMRKQKIIYRFLTVYNFIEH